MDSVTIRIFFQLALSGVIVGSIYGLIALGFPQSNLGLDAGDFSITATLVPAPGTTVLLGVGGLVALRRRRTA